jgi:hypothetical protein
MSEPTIQLSLSAYDELRGRQKVLTDKIVQLESELLAAKVAPPAVQDFLAVTDAALAVVRFAVANLPVENVRHWPHEALASFASALPTLPGCDTQQIRETAAILRDRAREIAEYEAGRVAVTHELRKALAEGLPNGLLCVTCGQPQYAHAGGARCKSAHVVEGRTPESPADFDTIADAFEQSVPA